MRASDVVKVLSDQSQAGGFAEVRAGERVSDVIENAASVSGLDASQFQAVMDGGGAGILLTRPAANSRDGLNQAAIMCKTSQRKTSSRKWSTRE